MLVLRRSGRQTAIQAWQTELWLHRNVPFGSLVCPSMSHGEDRAEARPQTIVILAIA